MENIGKYKVLREIGKGGMGIVYKAIDPETKRELAIKVLHPTMVDRTSVERFNREARAMAKLKHPNIVEVVDFGSYQGRHLFAMEYIKGKSLKWIIEDEGKMPIQRAITIIKQVAQALAYAHREGMIHRDIKPGNIMIDKDDQVKVMDFGLVQIPGITQVTRTGMTVGTPEYISPEQFSGEEVDSRTDIYSLGVTLYEMLAGTPPFKGESSYAILMKHKYELPLSLRNLRNDLPLHLEEIVMKAMAKDIGKRYLRLEEFISDLDRFSVRKKSFPENTEAKKEKDGKKLWRRLLILVIAGILLAIGFLRYYIKEKDVIKSKDKDRDLIEETLTKLKELENAKDTRKDR